MQKTFYIIDNGTATTNLLKRLFDREFSEYHCVGVSGTYEESMNTILKYSPDLVFANIDIFLNGESIFGFANELRQYKNTIPTFVAMSNSKDQAYKVIKNGFFDLLLKPLNELDLRKTLSKYGKQEEVQKPSTLCLKSYTDYRYVNTEEILYLKADNNSTDIFTSDGKVVTGYQTMKYFEDILPNNFIRIHHSYIINIDHVTRIHFGKSKCTINKVKDHIPFSRTYRSNVEFLKEALAKSSILSPN